MEELKELFSWRVVSCYYLLFLSFRGGVYSNYFFFSFLNNFLDPTHKQLAPPSQAQWQRANRAFTWTPVGLNPQPFFQVQVRRWAITLSHHPRGVLTSNNLGCNMDTSPCILFKLFIPAWSCYWVQDWFWLVWGRYIYRVLKPAYNWCKVDITSGPYQTSIGWRLVLCQDIPDW